MAQIGLQDLEVAIRERHFHVVYQPQVTTDGTTTVGVEALVRWTDATQGVVPPTCFIPLAEESGLIAELGKFVLRQACEDGLAWPPLTIGVNVSPVQFKASSFVSDVLSIITASGLPYNRLELEITETAYFDDVGQAEKDLALLRSHGIRIALDDFGVGYSSLTYLRRLPFDKVKIDKSFVDDVHTVGSAALIQAVCGLSRSLGMKVTAEGVETAEQQRLLKLCGCNHLQGYLFSSPVKACDITERLAREKSARAHTIRLVQ